MALILNYYRYLALIFTDILCIKDALLGLLGLSFTVASRRVAKVLIGVFVEPQILLSAGGALTRGFRGHATPESFENLGS